MSQALARLAGTRVETNIETGGHRARAGFGLIDSWRVVERAGDARAVSIEVTLPDWLFRAVDALELLSMPAAYFELRGALERRLYELARKHCGRQPKWRVSLAVLQQKSGSTVTAREFRRLVKEVVAADALPGYLVNFDPTKYMMTFRRRNAGA